MILIAILTMVALHALYTDSASLLNRKVSRSSSLSKVVLIISINNALAILIPHLNLCAAQIGGDVGDSDHAHADGFLFLR
jgi:hypothetical protein